MSQRPREDGDLHLGRRCSEHAARLCDELRWPIARVSVADGREGWSVVAEHLRGDDGASTRAALARSGAAADLRDRVCAAGDVVVDPSLDDPSSLHAAVGIPVRDADGRIAAVLELYSADALGDVEVVAAMARFAAWQLAALARRDGEDSAARESQRQALLFNHILEHLESAVFVANPKGELILMNRAARAIARAPADGARPHLNDARDFIFKEDGVTPMRPEDTVMARTLRGEAAPEQLVLIRDASAPSGTWVLSTGRQLVDDGEVIGAVVLAYDVTRLRREEERFRSLLEAAPDAMVIIDETGSIVLVNSQTEALFGLPRAELVGQPVEVLIPARYHGIHPAHRERYFANPTSRAMGAGLTLTGRRADGQEFPVEISLSPLATDGGPLAIAAIRDVTDRVESTRALAAERAAIERANAELRRKEAELRRSNAELEDFAYAASHDLRAPLRAIRSLAGFLAEDLGPDLPAASQGHLDLLQARVRRMDGLLASLLEYARVGRSDTTVVTIGLRELIERAIGLAAVPPGFVVVHAAPDVELVTVRVLLKRVLLNLIANAVKHHDRGEGRIEIGGRDLGDALELWVEDDGPGIAPEFHERIFGLFQTLRPRDEVEGSGMGLSLVRKIVTVAGGTIQVVSSGRGARFVFTWPKEWPR